MFYYLALKTDIRGDLMENKEDRISEELHNEKIENVENTEETKEDVAELEKLKRELESKTKEIEELNNRFLRLQADFVNFKTRVEKEKESIYSYASEDILNSMLPILDNFERALSSSTDVEDGFYKGMEMIYNQLIKVLSENGLEEIEALHEKFDPNYHHAVFQEESDEYEEGTIIEVFQKGYKLKDKVIRPSMVKVAK
ncbi:MAG: Protein GrpE [Sporanaerobacter sp.]|jgi:molecular chaperone GrpE|uniref:nucleotide exchange factor GrpE n=1 Tax=Sporanaerobacter sp. TaxID=2010183 RepID=UPI003A0FC302